MANSDPIDFNQRLRSHMARSGIASYRALSQTSGAPRSAIDRLRQGQALQLRGAALQGLSQALGVSLAELVETFSEPQHEPPGQSPRAQPQQTLASLPDEVALVKTLRQECDRLQTQLTTQAEALRQQVQQAALAQLEPWLVQWPTAAHAAQQNPSLSAQKLLPLLRPVEALVQQWGVTAIETVGAEVPFNPQIHQPREAVMQPGELVRVSHVGYRQGDRLLYRARVSPAGQG